jgi:uncharacterized protein (DUF2062 family)
MKRYLHKFRASIVALTPRQITTILVVGLVLGVFPLPGVPTFLCFVAALGLRLNIPALQLLNNVTSPLQFVLWFPLERIGARLCGSSLAPFAASISATAMHAVLGWTCVCLPAGVLIHFASTQLLTRRYNGSETLPR